VTRRPDGVREHPNAAVIRRMHQALARGDYVSTLAELFSEDIVWHLPGSGPLAGDHIGREAVLAAMRRFEEISEGTLRVEVHDIIASDDHTVALLRATATRKGRRYDSPEVDVYHVEDGKITEFWSFAEDQRVTDEFFN
jgi:ketosteroid isomerase-like protein